MKGNFDIQQAMHVESDLIHGNHVACDHIISTVILELCLDVGILPIGERGAPFRNYYLLHINIFHISMLFLFLTIAV